MTQLNARPLPKQYPIWLRRPWSAGMLALAAGLLTPMGSLAETITGSASFQLGSWSMGAAIVDVSALPNLAALQLTSVRATFTAEVLGDMHQSEVQTPDFALQNKERAIYAPPNCYGLPVAWCGVERQYYTRDVVTTLTQSDYAQMRIQVGGVAGADNVKGTLTESSLQAEGRSNYEQRESFFDSSDPNSIGLMEVFKYYESNRFLRKVWSSKSQLSVTLDLDAATMAAISSTGQLRYDGFAELLLSPTLRIDYTGVSAVPEPASAAMAFAGLALLAGIGARKKRKSS